MDEPGYGNGLVRRSLTRFYLLATGAARPVRGYELARAIADLGRGCCDPSEAALYPGVNELSEVGFCAPFMWPL